MNDNTKTPEVNKFMLTAAERKSIVVFSRKFFLIAGLVLLLGGVWDFFATRHFLRVAKPAIGTVVAIEIRNWGNHSFNSYDPVYTFKTRDNQQMKKFSGAFRAIPEFRENQIIMVLYDPKHPKTSRIDDFNDIWLNSYIKTGFGLLFFLIFLILKFLKFNHKEV